MSEEAAFLAALKANPADDTVRLVYADWLDEQDQPEAAEYLRLADALSHDGDDLAKPTDRTGRIVALGETLPEPWRSAAAGRFDLIFHALGTPSQMIQAIKAVRDLTGAGLAEMKQFMYTLPQRVFAWLPFDSAALLREHLLDRVPAADVRIEPSDPATSSSRRSLVITAGCWVPHGPGWDDPGVRARAQDALRAFLATLPLPAGTADGASLGEYIPIATDVSPTALLRCLRELRALAAAHSTNTAWHFYVRAAPM